jgi:exosome complex RNA-binding protein Csl4
MQDRRILTFDGKFFYCVWRGETTTTHPQTGDIVICLLTDFAKMIALLNEFALTRKPAAMAGINTDAVLEAALETATGFTPYNSVVYVIT